MTTDYTTSFQVALYLTTLLVTIVFAWVLVFAIVIMPGIAKLEDGGYLRAFQVIDGIIQNNQPIFVLVWIGSAIAAITLNVLTFTQLGNDENDTKALVTIAVILYLLSQVSTFTKNVPLNNRVQTLQIDQMDSYSKQAERETFEGPWAFWNNLRTVVMGVSSLYFLYLTLNI